MNKHYKYENMDLWYEERWADKLSPLVVLADYAAKKNLYHDEPCPRANPEKDAEGARFDPRLNAWLPDSMFEEWERKGMRLIVNHAGEHWMALIPKSVFAGENYNPKTLMIIRETDYRTPFWAMDTVEVYRDYFEAAAREGSMLVFTVMSRVDRSELAVIILREITQRYKVKHRNLYMDVDRIAKAGLSLQNVPGFAEKYCPRENPDDYICNFFNDGVKAISITDKWASKNSLQLANFYNGGIGTVPLDYDRLIYGHIGRRCASALRLEMEYDTDEDPRVAEFLDSMGIEAVYRETEGNGWVTVVPKSALDEPDKPLPCMCVMQEINPSDRHTVLSAFAMWYEYLEIAAQGDLMLLFFVLEDPEDNELLCKLIEETKALYPFMDRSRLYITGHSHNGMYSMEFYRRHPAMLAGAGIMGGSHGFGGDRGVVPMTDEQLDEMAKTDMPLININGDWENTFIALEASRELGDANKVKLWQNRERAFNCPVSDPEKILSVKNSRSKADRMLGVPVDRSETVYFEGDECYIGDVINNEGLNHLRLVTLENMPHGTTAHMPWLTWSFLRRFARDTETGKITELF